MPNPRDIQEMNTRSLALIMENDPTVARIFDRRICSGAGAGAVHAIFTRPTIVGEMQEAPSVTMETGFYGEQIFNVVKISPPSFLNKEQSEFFMNKFPLKDKNE